MSTLFLLRDAPTTEDMEILTRADEDDAVVLLQDGVTAFDDLEAEIPVYVSGWDVEIRGLESREADTVDYDDVADLIADHDKVVTL